ncbi:hypothetical protein [Streptomyces syringium]|uniref:DNA-binding beta-propeller fold protein YncE n=1 Tax=Streptomyces syringium TaxID=76729 RepID=A0ABS4XWC1_9ACTN|nr:hypothetical protein [Streptomyces syringium]MBP2400803.1 DNA-binding beta-propeller fold protein YncE [Streptomyces syringium]
MSKLTLYTPAPFRIRTIDTSTRTVSDPVSSLEGGLAPNQAGILLVDTPRSLVYRAGGSGSESVDEFDVSNPKSPTVAHLQAGKGAKLWCAALAGGFGQPAHVDQRLYCGGSDGFIYTFPLDSSGKTRKTNSAPAPYEVVEAHGRPIMDLAITSDGTHAFALIQSNDGKAAAVTKDLKPMPHPPGVHYLADRPQWNTIPSPEKITLTPDERHLIVTSFSQNKCTVIDTTTNKSYERSLAESAGWPVRVSNTTAYFLYAGQFHSVELASEEKKMGPKSGSGMVFFFAIGAGRVLFTRYDSKSMWCNLCDYDGNRESHISSEHSKNLPLEAHKDMAVGIGAIVEGG